MLDFLSIILFRNSQEICFYSCQIPAGPPPAVRVHGHPLHPLGCETHLQGALNEHGSAKQIMQDSWDAVAAQQERRQRGEPELSCMRQLESGKSSGTSKAYLRYVPHAMAAEQGAGAD